MSINSKAEPLDFFTKKCKEHNLKITPQRVTIYKELIKSKNHPSADTVFKEIKKEFPNISFDTVNRTLLTFYNIGLVGLVEGRGSPRRFDANLENHHHFFCIKCGKIIDFTNEEFSALPIPEPISKDFKVIQKRVILNGICSTCKTDDDQW
jgi:Fur family peroxide stress response transcriptional regulator